MFQMSYCCLSILLSERSRIYLAPRSFARNQLLSREVGPERQCKLDDAGHDRPIVLNKHGVKCFRRE